MIDGPKTTLRDLAAQEVQPDWKPEKRAPAKRRTTPKFLDARETFKQVVCADDCIAEGKGFGECEFPLQAMHVVSRQALRNRGLSHLEWDPTNGVSGCYRHHRRHDNAVEVLPMELLPARCIAWAERYGLLDVLERYWPPTIEGAAA